MRLFDDVGHRLAAEDDRVASGGHALAAHRVDRRLGGGRAGLVREVPEPRGGGRARPLGALGLDHRGDERADQRGLVGLHARHVRGDDRDPLLQHRDVATHDQAELAQPLVAAAQLRQLRGVHERPQCPVHDRPAGLDQPLVRYVHQLRIVVVAQRPRLTSPLGQRNELRIRHRRLPRLRQRPRRPRRAEIARLTPEPQQPPRRRVKHRLNPNPIRLDRLRLLHPIARNMRRVIEPRQQTPVRRRKHFDLADITLRPHKIKRLLRRPSQLHRRPHQKCSSASVVTPGGWLGGPGRAITASRRRRCRSGCGERAANKPKSPRPTPLGGMGGPSEPRPERLTATGEPCRRAPAPRALRLASPDSTTSISDAASTTRRCLRRDSPSHATPAAPHRAPGGSATRAYRGCCWPPGPTRADRFSRRRRGRSSRSQPTEVPPTAPGSSARP